MDYISLQSLMDFSKQVNQRLGQNASRVFPSSSFGEKKEKRRKTCAVRGFDMLQLSSVQFS